MRLSSGNGLVLTVMDGSYALLPWPQREAAPGWAKKGAFYASIRWEGEGVLLCEAACVPEGTKAEPGWRILKIEGAREIGASGGLAEIAGKVAGAGLAVIAIPAPGEDYLAVREAEVEKALETLRRSAFGCL